VLRFVNSFEGREDTDLADRLLAELPGIFLWAVRGWERLHTQRRFTRPASSADVIESMEETGSPLGTFLKERCEVGPRFQVECDELYSQWCEYCQKTGRREPGAVTEFGRLLRACLPTVKRVRVRTPEGLAYLYKGVGVCGDSVPGVPRNFPMYARSEQEHTDTHAHTYVAYPVPREHREQIGAVDEGIEI
jgi:putative DNA primase/helicase